MKRILFILAVLMGTPQAHAQHEMKLVESGGESHVLAHAHMKIGNDVQPYNHDVDTDDIVLPSLTVPELNGVQYDATALADRGFGTGVVYSESSSTLNFSGTYISSTFVTNPFFSLSPYHYQESWVGPITNGLKNKADGRCFTAGRYSIKLVPEHIGIWGPSRAVPVKMTINLSMNSPVFGPLTVSPYRDAIAYVKLTCNGSYYQATWDDEHGYWSIAYNRRNVAGGGYTTYSGNAPPGGNLNVEFTTYEDVAYDGTLQCEAKVSTSPTTVSVMLPEANNSNHVDQGVENYVGSGSGSGGIDHDYFGVIKITPLVKVKTP